MLKREWKKYFDGEWNPDLVYGKNMACLEKEKEMEKYLQKHCRDAFSSEEAYGAFEEKIFEMVGAFQVIASEAGFEKGVLCGMKLAKEK